MSRACRQAYNLEIPPKSSRNYRSILTLDGSKVRRVYIVARERYTGMKYRYSYFTYLLPFDGTQTRYLLYVGNNR